MQRIVGQNNQKSMLACILQNPTGCSRTSWYFWHTTFDILCIWTYCTFSGSRSVGIGTQGLYLQNRYFSGLFENVLLSYFPQNESNEMFSWMFTLTSVVCSTSFKMKAGWRDEVLPIVSGSRGVTRFSQTLNFNFNLNF